MAFSAAGTATAAQAAVSAPTLTLISNENPAPRDGSPSFLAALQPAPACGTVTWLIDGAPPAAGIPSGGTGGSYALGPVTGLSVGNHLITASYSGCETAGATTGTLTETVTDQVSQPPRITAQVVSAVPKHHGWYSRPVLVNFTCTAGSVPFSPDDCPEPVLLTKNQGGQSVTAMITDSAGRTASVKVSHINIDQVPPKLRVSGAANGATYRHRRPLTCYAADALSGVARCTIRKAVSHHHGVTKVKWVAVATDVAGNVRAKTGHYRVTR
ncbi:MAG TPA: Ig-like domain-containing protein [Mycobacteriales bacterium]|nr:Ig-like domain-containing protein [Mycobacteriales bacterium]